MAQVTLIHSEEENTSERSRRAWLQASIKAQKQCIRKDGRKAYLVVIRHGCNKRDNKEDRCRRAINANGTNQTN